MALSTLGFNRPTYDELLDRQIERAKELFGETIDTSELTALGKYIRINVLDLDELYQTLEGVYLARFPHTANGVSLDRLCPFAGISRNEATCAVHQVRFTGTPNAEIEVGFEVSDESQAVIFHTIDDYVIGSNGTVIAEVECDESGVEGNITSASINTIVNPVADVALVEGLSLVTLGEDSESDTELRQRFDKAISGTGSGTADAIKGAVMRVSGVDDCTIVEDVTNGRFKCVVSYDGGFTAVDSPTGNPSEQNYYEYDSNAEAYSLSEDTTVNNSKTYYMRSTSSAEELIAEAIFSKKPIGVKTYGSIGIDVSVEGEDNPHTIYFDATNKSYISIRFAIITNNQFEEDGVAQIQSNIINYLSGFSNGETLYVSSLYSYINITGVVSVSGLSVTKGGTTYTDSVEFSANEVVRALSNSILVFTKVEAPTGNPHDNEYYEKSGNTFVLSADTTVNVSKTYYTLLNETEE